MPYGDYRPLQHFYPWYVPMEPKCPNCDRCPHCGQPVQPKRPFIGMKPIRTVVYTAKPDPSVRVYL